MSGSENELGLASFEWARSHMPVFTLAEEYVRKKDSGRNLFRGLQLCACLHVSKETAVLIESFHSLGIQVKLVAANPLSSQNDIVAFLKGEGVSIDARSKESFEEYKRYIEDAARSEPNLIVDDGGELHVAYSKTNSSSCNGGTDETTSGVTRLRILDKEGRLRYPVVPVNDAETKHIFDNKYGSGQSAVDGLIRATGILLSGKCVVVAGYGWVGRGVAERLRGMGARVLVTEVDGIKALEAFMDGFELLPMLQAALQGDVFLTCTGQIDVIRSEHFDKMKNGAVIGNVGHFDREIDVVSLCKGRIKTLVRKNVERIEFNREKSLFLLCEGRVVNLVAAEGHPPEIMQLSFSNQLLSLYYLVENGKELRSSKSKMLEFPKEIDKLVMTFAMKGFGIRIDNLTESQLYYAGSS